MKERNLLFFISAVIASILFVISLLIRTQRWFNVNEYGIYASIKFYYYIVPVALFWLAWYLNDHNLLLAALLVMVGLLYWHLEHVTILSGIPTPLVISYAPAIKTTYVLSLILQAGSLGFGFTAYLMPLFKKEA